MFKTILDFFTLTFFKSFCWLVRSVPEALGRIYCFALVRIFILLLSRSKTIALHNLKTCFPQNSNKQNHQIYENSLSVLADNLYTFCLIPKLNQKFVDEHVDLANFTELYTSLKKKSPHGGVIFATAHFGSFELMASISAIVNGPTSILARGLGFKKTDAWWNKIRTMLGNEVYSRKGGYKETISRLKEGKNVALLCDQNVKANYAVFSKLFGITSSATITVGHAASITSAPILFVVMAKIKNDKYKIICSEIETPISHTDLDDFTIKVMHNYHQTLEKAISEFPDHWFWFHRRFKTRPKGEKENFYESIDNS